MRLNNTEIRWWKDLVGAFVKQYKFNIDITLDKSSLLMTGKENKETSRSMPKGGERRPLKLSPYY